MSTRVCKTAHDVFTERMAEVSAKLKSVEGRLTSFAQKEQMDPKNWGYAGSLGYVDSILDELLEFLS